MQTPSDTISSVDLPGRPNMPLNIWGKTTLLLDLLYIQGWLPECHIYGTEEPGYTINGIPAGETESEVTSFVWRMVECYKKNGYLAD